LATRLLIIDDDPTLLRFLKEYFEREGFTVDSAAGGQAALRLFFANRPDLVIVDVMMPGMDGWEVTARLRELADTPVIMLTAKSGEADKLRGFRLGVDDYVTKPFSLAELGARVAAVLARAAAGRASSDAVYRAGAITVDMKKREVLLDQTPLTLTPTEFRVLACLAERAGEAVSQEDLVERAWGVYRQEGGSALRRYIWFLRKKIEDDPESPQRLVTVRGFGYRLEK
jgi:DNA-binding response OmpR family regulator